MNLYGAVFYIQKFRNSVVIKAITNESGYLKLSGGHIVAIFNIQPLPLIQQKICGRPRHRIIPV
jgi:hypothetical protein